QAYFSGQSATVSLVRCRPPAASFRTSLRATHTRPSAFGFTISMTIEHTLCVARRLDTHRPLVALSIHPSGRALRTYWDVFSLLRSEKRLADEDSCYGKQGDRQDVTEKEVRYVRDGAPHVDEERHAQAHARARRE